MSRVDYEMSAADLRTFDRWHARGALILVAALLLMPWILGIGPNAARDLAAPSAAPSAAPAGAATPATPATGDPPASPR
jgi:hypothetical protein